MPHQPAIPDVDILWITAGLGCDGDSVAITAATQPSIEDIVRGAIPGLPEVTLHHPLLATQVGGEFLQPFHQAASGMLITTDLVDINLGIRIQLGSSSHEGWQQQETFVTHYPLGNPVDQRHPWNQTTTPWPPKREFSEKYTWDISPRWHDRRSGDMLAIDTGGGPLARQWEKATSRGDSSAQKFVPLERRAAR